MTSSNMTCDELIPRSPIISRERWTIRVAPRSKDI